MWDMSYVTADVNNADSAKQKFLLHFTLFLLRIVSKEHMCGMNVNLYPCTTLLCLKFTESPSLVGETLPSMIMVK